MAKVPFAEKSAKADKAKHSKFNAIMYFNSYFSLLSLLAISIPPVKIIIVKQIKTTNLAHRISLSISVIPPSFGSAPNADQLYKKNTDG